MLVQISIIKHYNRLVLFLYCGIEHCGHVNKSINVLGLYEDAKGPKCNPDFTSEIGANDLILQPALYR